MILDPNIEERDYKEANMYLAEDRILSLGIYCQQEKSYILKYIPNAIARTDPMKTLEDVPFPHNLADEATTSMDQQQLLCL